MKHFITILAITLAFTQNISKAEANGLTSELSRDAKMVARYLPTRAGAVATAIGGASGCAFGAFVGALVEASLNHMPASNPVLIGCAVGGAVGAIGGAHIGVYQARQDEWGSLATEHNLRAIDQTDEDSRIPENLEEGHVEKSSLHSTEE